MTISSLCRIMFTEMIRFENYSTGFETKIYNILPCSLYMQAGHLEMLLARDDSFMFLVIISYGFLDIVNRVALFNTKHFSSTLPTILSGQS